MKHIKYLKYIIRHKYYVARECFKYGLVWRGIKHDWSKFLPSEWFPYVESFYGNRHGLGAEENFDKAWLHHQHFNSHHWQHHVLREDRGTTKILQMPYDDAVEMYCDWVGAGLAITGKRDIEEWYEKNGGKILLHPETRRFVENLIYKNDEKVL